MKYIIKLIIIIPVFIVTLLCTLNPKKALEISKRI
jgi:hypothetical protein